MILALYACAILAGCGSTSEFWQPETQIDDRPLGPARATPNTTAGMLEVRLTQNVERQTTPVERLTLLHEEVDMTFDWDSAGMILLYIVGSVLVAVIYLFAGTSTFRPEDEE